MDAYATINNTWEISQKTSYLLGNVDTGIREFMGMLYHVNDMQMITSWVAVDDVTWKPHKMITQINHTNESHKTIAQGKMMHVQEWKQWMMLSDAPEQLRCIWRT